MVLAPFRLFGDTVTAHTWSDFLRNGFLALAVDLGLAAWHVSGDWRECLVAEVFEDVIAAFEQFA